MNGVFDIWEEWVGGGGRGRFGSLCLLGGDPKFEELLNHNLSLQKGGDQHDGHAGEGATSSRQPVLVTRQPDRVDAHALWKCKERWVH